MTREQTIGLAVSYLIIDGLRDHTQIFHTIQRACELARTKTPDVIITRDHAVALRNLSGLEYELLKIKDVSLEEVCNAFVLRRTNMIEDYKNLLDASDGDENDSLLVWLREQAKILGLEIER
jgi:hypothetical protein